MHQPKIKKRLKFSRPLIVLLCLGLVLASVTMASRYMGHDKLNSSPSSSQLIQSLEQITASLSLAPHNNVTPAPQAVIVKSAPAYYVATGVSSNPEEIARVNIINTLNAQNWTITRHGNVDHSLGWEVAAIRNSMVLQISAGEAAKGVTATPYTRLNGQTYVQAAIAAQNSGPDWSVIQK